jgi:hypothetical protein
LVHWRRRGAPAASRSSRREDKARREARQRKREELRALRDFLAQMEEADAEAEAAWDQQAILETVMQVDCTCTCARCQCGKLRIVQR